VNWRVEKKRSCAIFTRLSQPEGLAATSPVYQGVWRSGRPSVTDGLYALLIHAAQGSTRLYNFCELLMQIGAL
jgi:hypothetical protein